MNRALNKKHPEDVQIRFDLCRAYQCLGDLQFEQGKLDAAVASIVNHDRSVMPWSRSFQAILDMPIFSHRISPSWGSSCMPSTNPNRSSHFRNLPRFTEKLVTTYPDNFEYKIGQARCLRDQGTIVASLGRAAEAEGIYRKALALFDANV